ncbi:uncharacterized protein [Watersipora subatra]|uniref:uncharacterized protein n=1 Tax=Watersipora subatra TaxID=2589382 RepID=UPI00355B19B0
MSFKVLPLARLPKLFLTISILSSVLEQSVCAAGLTAGPIYHVIIKYPDWISSGYLREAAAGGLTFTNLDSTLSSLNDFSIFYYYDAEKELVYFAIKALSNQKWISHNGAQTKRHSPAMFTEDNSDIINSEDHRLFYCVSSICNHKGAVAQIPGTDLFLNGEMRYIDMLTFDRLNYLTFLASHYSRTQPNTPGHVGTEWAFGKHLISDYH